MSGTTTTQGTDRRPRRWRFVALASSLTLALAGLVGLGLAPAASADTTCPDGYTLNAEGTVCELYQTQLAEKTVTYTCPTEGGWGDAFFDEDYYAEGEGAWVCQREVPGQPQFENATQQYRCEVGNLVRQGDHWACEITQSKPSDKTNYTCPSGTELVFQGGVAKCKTEISCPTLGEVVIDRGHNQPPDKCYAYPDAPGAPGCSGHGWQYNAPSGMCQKSGYEDAEPYNPPRWMCREGWTLAADDMASVNCPTPPPTPQCTRTPTRIETILASETTVYTCPAGWTGPLPEEQPTGAVEVEPYCEITLTATPTVTTAGGPPFVDFCPDLAGEQWENYDCNTPQPVAAEVVAPVGVVAPVQVTPAPATVTSPAAATVEAPAPAAVSAGVAGTAAVADTATVPAAVPAGGGPQAPAVPIWALAMIVVGVIGMAAAGRQLVTTK